MRRSQLIVLLGLSLGAGAAAASAPSGPVGTHGAAYTVDVAVQSVTPHYRYDRISTPVQSCRMEPVSVRYHNDSRYRAYGHHHRDSYRTRADGGAVLLGGLIGGLIGNRVGDGRGRPALTVAGAALGATLAGDLSRRPRHFDRYHAGPGHAGYEQRYARRCSQVQQTRQVRVIDGYDVSYRYNGQTFSKWLREHPGSTVPVTVSVSPLR